MHYPDAIVRALADPRGGIAGEQTFLPSIAELRASLERRMAPIYAREEKRRRYTETEDLLKAAEVADAEARERGFEHWQAMRPEFGATEVKRRRGEAEAEAHLEQLREKPALGQPLTISVGLQEKLRAMLDGRPGAT